MTTDQFVRAGAARAGLRSRALAVSIAALAAVSMAAVATPSALAGEPPADPRPVVAYPHDDVLRLNQLQVLGTHNSYHLAPQEQFATALEELLPGVVQFFDYEHRPLPEQFEELGIRQIELDVFADPAGGLYDVRRAHELAGLPRDPDIPELEGPGFKVLHVQEVDVESSCWTFVSCLQLLEDWSSANPGHAPIMVLVEAKDDEIPDPYDLGFVPPVPIDGDRLDELDAEIRSVFDEDHLLTPDDVRGERATLEEAVLTDGWPTLGESRGKVLFGLDNGGGVMDDYLDGHPTLEGRAMFVGGTAPGHPATAFRKLNNPEGSFDEIQDSVEAGYIVRTRADDDPTQTEPGRYEQRDTALASGAQFVSTDYPEPDLDGGDPDYVARIPGGMPARCNPLSAPAWCEATDIEHPVVRSGLPACDEGAFADVAATNPFCDVISWMAERDLLVGDDGAFAPGRPVLRQEVAAVLFRLEGGVAPDGPCEGSPFVDVPVSHPFCHEITWLVERGGAAGFGDGTFRPALPVARQELAAMLFGLAGAPLPDAPCGVSDGFDDVGAEHPFCRPIMWLAGDGVVIGYPDGRFGAADAVTRQALAAVAYRTLLVR